MINFLTPTTEQRFREFKKGDILIIEFDREFDNLKGLLHSFVLPEQNYIDNGEIILQKKGNVYFNYKMHLIGQSIVKNVTHVFL